MQTKPLHKSETFENGATDTDQITSEEILQKQERGEWNNRIEFILSIVGYTVGIGSVWRFPIICMRNGGGAFIIPYLSFLLLCGAPLYYLEICLGQFTGNSPVAAFEMCRLFKGLGGLMVAVSFTSIVYVTLLMAWIIFFLINSFYTVLPWSTCDNWWNTASCREYTNENTVVRENHAAENTTYLPQSELIPVNISNSSSMSPALYSSPANEFWLYNVLRKSSGLEEYGTVQLHIALCLLAAWVIVCLCLIKGVKSVGKVVYVTATAPYLLLTIMLVRGLTLDGSTDGLKVYFTPDFRKLTTLQVWQDAAIQVFYSLGPSWGGVITMSSYNKFHTRNFSSTVIVIVAAGFTSIYGGLVVFTILGFMAKTSGMTVDQVASASGAGLVFVVYPEAISRMPLPHLWAVLFFLMLMTVFLDSVFGMGETIVGAVIDTFPRQLTSWRITVTIGVTTVMYLLGLPFTTNGGIYLFQLFDWYTTAFALLLGSALEAVIISWIYGADRFSKDIQMMTGRHSSVFLRFLWCIFTPGFAIGFFFLMLTKYQSPDYGDGYIFRPYAVVLGNIIAVLPLLTLTVSMTFQVIKSRGSARQCIKQLFSPTEKWGPKDIEARAEFCRERYTYQPGIFNRIWLNVRGTTGTPIM